jgi:aldehyde dehydrogenase (NAD+)
MCMTEETRKTRSLSPARHVLSNAWAGCVMINLPTVGPGHLARFGKRGVSGGRPREQGRHSEDSYTTVKASWIFSGSPA